MARGSHDDGKANNEAGLERALIRKDNSGIN
jgi:hypothetical protein